MSPSFPAPLAITMGDPAGIGPEIIAKAYRDAPAQTADCLVVGDLAVMQRACALVAGAPTPQLIRHPAERATLSGASLPVFVPPPQTSAQHGLASAHQLPPVYGQLSARAGAMAADAVIWAARAALRSDLSGLVTAPLNKLALSAAGLSYPGHTELLQAEAAQARGLSLEQLPVRMMLANDELRTVLVSIHLSLRQAIEAVTFEQVLTTLRISHAALGRWAGRHRAAAPRLAVAGLNPHAGEGGLLGDEEIRIIMPAIEAARREGIQVEGPYPPDTVFMRARQLAGRRDGFDAVIAMYHDQGLIPVKYLGMERGVNVTLGLPLVRTSPDHGTAFDIAGQGVAAADSLLQAIQVARQLTQPD
jgi:4-hydroxythreonine-4-phosphate dehydrogenase